MNLYPSEIFQKLHFSKTEVFFAIKELKTTYTAVPDGINSYSVKNCCGSLIDALILFDTWFDLGEYLISYSIPPFEAGVKLNVKA